MAIFKNRLTPIRDIVFVWAVCVFPIYSWAILTFLEKMPGWLFHLSPWDVIGIFAYTQTFAVLESGIAVFVLIFIGVILPARFFRDRFVAQGSMIVFLTSIWAIVTHYSTKMFNLWTLKTLFLWSVLYLTSVGGVCVLLYRYKRLEEAMNSFAERLTVLLYVYVPVTFLSIIIVILRNT